MNNAINRVISRNDRPNTGGPAPLSPVRDPSGNPTQADREATVANMRKQAVDKFSPERLAAGFAMNKSSAPTGKAY